MKLRLIRYPFYGMPTIGELLIDRIHFCYTLEDQDRGLQQHMTLEKIQKKKVSGATAIPYGTYAVVLTFSPKFKWLLPLIVGIKGFEGVRIHRGNSKKDTLGCPLVGYRKSSNLSSDFAVLESKHAATDLVKRFEQSKDTKHSLLISKEDIKL